MIHTVWDGLQGRVNFVQPHATLSAVFEVVHIHFLGAYDSQAACYVPSSVTGHSGLAMWHLMVLHRNKVHQR